MLPEPDDAEKRSAHAEVQGPGHQDISAEVEAELPVPADPGHLQHVQTVVEDSRRQEASGSFRRLPFSEQELCGPACLEDAGGRRAPKKS